MVVVSSIFAAGKQVKFGIVFFAGLSALASGATVTVDGTNVSSLSAAVQTAQEQDDGPHVINITANSITADGPVLINEPMTINGDPDKNGKCDILVDIESVRKGGAKVGQPEKCYIEIQAAGDVVINDLMIHPNADGVEPDGQAKQRVDAIRMYKPAAAGEEGNYTLNRVMISGSDAADAYVPLDTPEDLYDATPKKWGGGGKGANNQGHGVIQLANTGGAGVYNAELNNCHAGLGKSSALNILAKGGIVQVDGGLYGHCGRDGIHIEGTGVVLTGSSDDRLRVLRVPCVSGGNAHGVEVEGGTVNGIEYVDVSTINTGNMFKFSNCKVGSMSNCRALGKMGDGVNAAMFVEGPCTVGEITDCTIVGKGDKSSPAQTTVGFVGSLAFKDCIFASESPSSILHAAKDATSMMEFTNCGLPTVGDGVGEKLLAASIDGPSVRQVKQTGSVKQTPNFQLTLKDYDWSDKQGAGDAKNGPGNANVLRPTSAAYTAGASDGSALTGGAGNKQY